MMASDSERVLSVFELSQGLKRTVESSTAGLWVEGEVGRLQQPGSGHLYFSLKDETRDAMVDCVMYKRDAMRFASRLSEGARVQLRGRASFYPPRGRLQWIAEIARPVGQGALLEALERLKKKIVAEGLASPERKQALPTDPRVVGVVTSATGAVFSDICTVAARRGGVRILLAPAIVQGEEAVSSILNALMLMERARPDVIILGRGGGSAEDLMAFNDERIVRRVAECEFPVVSAVGHEVDHSLTDLVADARAATPSQAAEMVVPDSAARHDSLMRIRGHMNRTVLALVTEKNLELARHRRKLGDPRFLVVDGQQRLDDLRLRMNRRGGATVARSREAIQNKVQRLYARHPRAVLEGARVELLPLRQRLNSAWQGQTQKRRSELSELGHSLSALSPLSVLGRGYALATTPDGQAVRDTSTIRSGDEVLVRVCQGSFSARVEKVQTTIEKFASIDHGSSTDDGKNDKR